MSEVMPAGASARAALRAATDEIHVRLHGLSAFEALADRTVTGKIVLTLDS